MAKKPVYDRKATWCAATCCAEETKRYGKLLHVGDEFIKICPNCQDTKYIIHGYVAKTSREYRQSLKVAFNG